MAALDEDGQTLTQYIQHYRVHEFDHVNNKHADWGPLKRIDYRFKQLCLT